MSRLSLMVDVIVPNCGVLNVRSESGTAVVHHIEGFEGELELAFTIGGEREVSGDVVSLRGSGG